MENKNIFISIVTIIGLAIVGWLMYGMVHRVEQKLAFIVDSVELSGRTELTVGKNSDINFDKVPHDYLTIRPEGDHFIWKVNPIYRDSLQYFKINNDNPNRHPILDSADQEISLKLVTSNNDTIPFSFTGADVWQLWKDLRNQKDWLGKHFQKDQERVLARHFATYLKFREKDVNREDSAAFLNQMQQRGVRSFFQLLGKDNLVMVILDRNTEIKMSGETHRYADSGITQNTGEEARCCKVQFFELSDQCYKEKEPEKGYFQIDGINYVMKVSVKLTEWGSGHVMIKSSGDKLTLHYPRPVTFVGTVDTLREKSRSASGLITLKQSNNSFPTKSDLYLPAFSNAINFDLCNLEFALAGDEVKVRDNNFTANTLSEKANAIVPTLEKITLCSGNDALHCRIGYIGQKFIFSYLFWPSVVFLILLLLIWLPFSPLKIDEDERFIYNLPQLRNFRLYFTFLLLMCLAYCACKSLIALKLSYTYPYFEKLTGITPVSTALMMLLFFSVAMLFNSPLANRKKPWYNAFTWFVSCILFGASFFVFFQVSDVNISQGAVSSYFGSEISFQSNPILWSDPSKSGINDTHRSVVYTLLLIEFIVLALWAVRWFFALERIKGLFKNIIHAPFIIGAITYVKQSIAFVKKLIKSPFVWIAELIESIGRKINRPWKIVLYFIVEGLYVIILYRFFSDKIQPHFNLSHLLSLSPLGMLAQILLMIAILILLLSPLISFVRDAFLRTLKVLFPWHFIALAIIFTIGLAGGNFATAFITLFVIVGLSSALSRVAQDVENSEEGHIIPRHTLLCEMFLITLCYIVVAMAGDAGYLTNYLGFFICAFYFFFLVKRPYEYTSQVVEEEARKEHIWLPILIAVIGIYIFALPKLCSILYSPEEVNYSRMSRRLMLYSNFEDLQKSGYRYCESDAEFMVIMSHYMQKKQTRDPLSNDYHFMHESVSSGQSPVVLNDLSVPIAFFGSYGVRESSAIYFILLFLLAWLVLTYSLCYEDENSTKLTMKMQWRLLALLMWAGTSIYIYMSYLDLLPFTGRLNPGYGVDAVGEALETAFLLAFMAAVTYHETDHC